MISTRVWIGLSVSIAVGVVAGCTSSKPGGKSAGEVATSSSAAYSSALKTWVTSEEALLASAIKYPASMNLLDQESAAQAKVLVQSCNDSHAAQAKLSSLPTLASVPAGGSAGYADAVVVQGKTSAAVDRLRTALTEAVGGCDFYNSGIEPFGTAKRAYDQLDKLYDVPCGSAGRCITDDESKWPAAARLYAFTQVADATMGKYIKAHPSPYANWTAHLWRLVRDWYAHDAVTESQYVDALRTKNNPELTRSVSAEAAFQVAIFKQMVTVAKKFVPAAEIAAHRADGYAVNPAQLINYAERQITTQLAAESTQLHILTP